MKVIGYIKQLRFIFKQKKIFLYFNIFKNVFKKDTKIFPYLLDKVTVYYCFYNTLLNELYKKNRFSLNGILFLCQLRNSIVITNIYENTFVCTLLF